MLLLSSQVTFGSYAAFGVEFGHLRKDNPLGTARLLNLLNLMPVFRIDLTNREPTMPFQAYEILLDDQGKTELIEAREILFQDQDAKS